MKSVLNSCCLGQRWDTNTRLKKYQTDLSLSFCPSTTPHPLPFVTPVAILLENHLLAAPSEISLITSISPPTHSSIRAELLRLRGPSQQYLTSTPLSEDQIGRSYSDRSLEAGIFPLDVRPPGSEAAFKHGLKLQPPTLDVEPSVAL